MSDKGSESDEGEANKDSPSERDEDSDKQSDTELDEMDGDDEEVRESQRRGWQMLMLSRSASVLKQSDPRVMFLRKCLNSDGMLLQPNFLSTV